MVKFYLAQIDSRRLDLRVHSVSAEPIIRYRQAHSIFRNRQTERTAEMIAIRSENFLNLLIGNLRLYNLRVLFACSSVKMTPARLFGRLFGLLFDREFERMDKWVNR